MFPLSDSTEREYQQTCNHQHMDRCEKCQGPTETLADIARIISRSTFANEDDKYEATFIFQTAKLAILSWKCHILRSAYQDQAKLDTLDKLDQETVLIVNDWAMKFLPIPKISVNKTALPCIRVVLPGGGGYSPIWAIRRRAAG